MKLPAAAAFAALAFAAPSSAQTVAGPVTIVVPFAAGGPIATLGGYIAGALSRSLGVDVTVSTVPGAGGTVGAAEVAAAAPDGTVLLLSHVGLAASETFYRTLPYDTATAFAPIGEVANVPMAVVGRANLPPVEDNLQGLIEYLAENGERVRMAHAGLGSSSHLCALLLTSETGVSPTMVAYDGTGPAMADLVAGNVDLMCDQVTNAAPRILADAVKGYAVTSAERLALLPEVPTVAEQGLPDFVFVVWHGLFAPAGTPPETVAALSAGLQAAVVDPTFVAALAALDVRPVAAELATPEALSTLFLGEIDAWRPVIEATGVHAD